MLFTTRFLPIDIIVVVKKLFRYVYSWFSYKKKNINSLGCELERRDVKYK